MLLNIKYIKHSDLIKNRYKKAFTQQESMRSKFAFLRKYLQFIESEENMFKIIEMSDDPTKSLELNNEIDEFNREIYNFLKTTIDSNASRINLRDAYFYIGVGYEYGIFTLKANISKALANYQLAARLKSPIGSYKLAQCYELGKGVRKNEVQALCFYRCAAKLGYTDAMYTYGMIKLQGTLSAETDEKLGFSFLQYACNTADDVCPYPCYEMGLIFEQGMLEDLHIDKQYAFEMYLKGSNLGDPNSIYRVALSYEHEDLVETRNTAKSITNYIKAADKGHMEAIMYLATHYKTGIRGYLAKSEKEAFYWNFRAAAKLNVVGLFNCAKSYEEGIGVEKDLLKALWFYVIAHDNGALAAESKIKELYVIISDLNHGEEKKFSFIKCLQCCK